MKIGSVVLDYELEVHSLGRSLGFGFWSLAFDLGLWAFGIALWSLVRGLQRLWTLDLGLWTLDFGLSFPASRFNRLFALFA